MEKLNETSTIVTPQPKTRDGGEDIFSPSLITLHGNQIGHRYELSGSVTTIGRSSACDIVLDDDNVSRRHAELVAKGQEVIINDLNSTNGTFVNAQKTRSAVLQKGDVVMISRVVMKYIPFRSHEDRFWEQMFSMATTDSLTCVYNRRFFQERLGKELTRALRHERPLSLLFYDIDDFKKVNDSFGHPVGDQVLKESATLINSQLRNDDVFCRFGGDEFAIICPETTGNQAAQLAERIKSLISKASFTCDGRRIEFTISIGIAQLDGAMKKGADLVEKADKALYQSKQSGRNRITY